MSAPLLDVDPSGNAALAAAVGIGFAFGWTLERAGLGNARKLSGQFDGTDFTVLKVMLTAIVTAALGVFWLGWLGLLDASRLYVPETFIVPQTAGGAIFGIGFALSGLCPGTSCVAAASGRGDGLAAVAGMFSGVLAMGLAVPDVAAFYESTPWGAVTLPDVLHVSPGAVAAFLALSALGVFRVLTRNEPAVGSGRVRHVLAVAAATLGGLAVLAGAPRAAGPGSIETNARVSSPGTGGEVVDALDLAEWIRDRRPGVRVVDVRSRAEFDAFHIPTATSAPLPAVQAEVGPANDEVVLYSGEGKHDDRARALFRSRGYVRVSSLRGGVTAWLDEVISPAIPFQVTAAQAAAFRRRAEVSRYFGGSPRRVEATPRAEVTLTAEGAGALVRRRGC